MPAEVMNERLQRLQALLNEQQHAFNRATVGRRTSVLIERRGKKPGQLIGKSPWLQSVHLETAAEIGDMVDVEILSAGPNSLAGAELSPKSFPGEGRGPASPPALLDPGLRRGTEMVAA